MALQETGLLANALGDRNLTATASRRPSVACSLFAQTGYFSNVSVYVLTSDFEHDK